VRAFGDEAGKLGELLHMVEDWKGECADDVLIHPAGEFLRQPSASSALASHVSGSNAAQELDEELSAELFDLAPDAIDDLGETLDEVNEASAQ